MLPNMCANNPVPGQLLRQPDHKRIAIFFAGLCGIGLIAGCSSSSTALPESPDQSYLREVNNAEVPFDSDEVAVKVGRGMCELIERAVIGGQSIADAKTILKQQSDRAGVYSTAHNLTIITAAVNTYCPEYATTKDQSPVPTPRATTATKTPEDTLNRMIKQFDQEGLPYESPQWLQDRATEVCAGWEKMGSARGFEYSVLEQSLNFRPVDFERSGLAVTYLTQYGCLQWFKYIR